LKLLKDRILSKIILDTPIINGRGGRRIVPLKATKHINGIISKMFTISQTDRYLGNKSSKTAVIKEEKKTILLIKII